MFGEIGQTIEHVKTWWWAYVLGYVVVTSLIGMLLRFLLRRGNSIVLTAMFYPAIMLWRLIRRLAGKR